MSVAHPARASIEPASLVLGPASYHAPSEREVSTSIAISLKRIADALDSSDSGGRPQGSVVWWLENIARAIDNASRS